MDVKFKPNEVENTKQQQSEKTCDFCSKLKAQYKCPRCNAYYCKVSCYQSPSHVSCSEAFYKDQVIGELKNCRITDENRAKVLDILKRDQKRAEQDLIDWSYLNADTLADKEKKEEEEDEEESGSSTRDNDDSADNDEDDDENEDEDEQEDEDHHENFNDENQDNDEDDDEEDDDNEEDDNKLASSALDPEKIDPDEMLRVYENAIKTWQPWWTSLKNKSSSLVFDDNDEKEPSIDNDLNERLVNNSTEINTSNASSLLYNEILKSSYLYILLTHVYQLNEDDFKKSTEIELSVLDEICSCYLEIEQLCSKSKENKYNSALDLASKLNFLIACLLQDENYFLKSYINKDFLTNLLDDLIVFCKHPMAHKRSLSHLYSVFEMSLTKKSTPLNNNNNNKEANLVEIVEKPINVFHINRTTTETTKTDQADKKKSRVEILSKRRTTPPKLDENTLPSSSVKVDKTQEKKKKYRMLLKKIEFYFKWLNVNLQSMQRRDCVESICGVISSLRDSIQGDLNRFNSDKNVIEKNFDFIRKKVNEHNNPNKKLIEEL